MIVDVIPNSKKVWKCYFWYDSGWYLAKM